MNSVVEEPVRFMCSDKMLYGILHRPEGIEAPKLVVNMVIGGPQTRVGSHRLFVQFARYLCRHGVTVLRFDYEGLGDSQGEFVGFRKAGTSIRASLDYLAGRFSNQPEVILWSLCDGSSASILYAAEQPKNIAGLILCNPFAVIDENDLARVFLKHYYGKRIFNKEFWLNMLNFRVNFSRSLRSLYQTVKKANAFPGERDTGAGPVPQPLLPELIINGLINFSSPIKIILGTNDLAARNFMDVLSSRKEIKHLESSKRISRHYIHGADHTFTDPAKKKELFQTTLQLVREIAQSDSGRNRSSASPRRGMDQNRSLHRASS